jgi:thiosulfate/3-mercaptopyruvate sulfurtransferase
MKWTENHSNRVVLADVRWYMDAHSGQEAYERGHLPGAVFVDVDRCLAGDPGAGRGRHPLPDPDAFAQAMSSLGIGDDCIVVAYDDRGGVIAARLVWMLRAIEHDAALLDGGIGAYEATLETEEPTITVARFTSRSWPIERLADISDATDPANVVMDARSPERYRGEIEPIDSRAGHIPGAVNHPCEDNLDEHGRMLPGTILRERFAAAGVLEGSSVVSYCGSGITACHNLLAIELCGLGQGRLYVGSWSEYSSMPGKIIETCDPGLAT